MADNTYSISADTALGVLYGDELVAALKASSLAPLYVSIEQPDTNPDILVIVTTQVLTPGEKTTLDGIVNTSPTLDQYKTLKQDAIQRKNTKLIEAGFEYPAASGNIFPAAAQDRLRFLADQTSSGVLAFPVGRNTKNGLGKLNLNNANDVRLFNEAATEHVGGIEASGTALEDQVRAATTYAEVDAVVDNR